MSNEREELLKQYRAMSMKDLLELRFHGDCCHPVAEEVIFQKLEQLNSNIASFLNDTFARR